MFISFSLLALLPPARGMPGESGKVMHAPVRVSNVICSVELAVSKQVIMHDYRANRGISTLME